MSNKFYLIIFFVACKYSLYSLLLLDAHIVSISTQIKSVIETCEITDLCKPSHCLLSSDQSYGHHMHYASAPICLFL